jgi:hypothetical protein
VHKFNCELFELSGRRNNRGYVINMKSLLQNGAEFLKRAADRQIHEDSRVFLDENSTVWE